MNAKAATQSALHVLYVEDEECDRLFMEAAFRKAGLNGALRMAVDGREAMNYLAGSGVYADRSQHPLPVVVLLDLNLPVFSGFDVLKWMRARPELAELPILIFSSSSKDEDRVKARALGANEFVEKPMSGQRFVEVVERIRGKWFGKLKVVAG